MMELAFYAILAMFIIARLYVSLGQTSNPEECQPSTYNSKEIVIDSAVEEIEKEEDISQFFEPGKAALLASRIEEINSKNPSFSIKNFLIGAEKTFFFIVQAINSGKELAEEDEKILRRLSSKGLFKEIQDKISKRVAKNLIHKTTVVCIRSIKVDDLAIDGSEVKISVRILSEQLSCVKDSANNIVEGDEKKIVLVEDFWIFSRHTWNTGPAWTLCAFAKSPLESKS